MMRRASLLLLVALARASDPDADWLAENAQRPGVITHESGLQYVVLASAPGAERFSAPFFYNPAYDAEVRPLAGAAPCYGPFAYGYWRRRRFEGDFADEGKPEIQISDYLLE